MKIESDVVPKQVKIHVCLFITAQTFLFFLVITLSVPLWTLNGPYCTPRLVHPPAAAHCLQEREAK